MFLPITAGEMRKLGWRKADVIIISGDAYVDSPFSGAAVIGKYLLSKGFKTAVIPQPSTDGPDDVSRLGEPALFWGVTAGCVDSLVANYTASGKPRRSCDNTPGGVNSRRPDRACIVYSNLIRRYFKDTAPIVLGGVEASLRRVAHYDFKTDGVRRSVLFDAKADALIYGMGETACLELAVALRAGKPWKNLRGLCYASKEIPAGSLELPSFEEAGSDKNAFTAMFKIFSDNADPVSGRVLAQKTGDRYLIQNPPSALTAEVLDETCELGYEREPHPLSGGAVRAAETVRFSMCSHRGCFGGCSFCAVAFHEGRRVVSRSLPSLLREAERLAQKKNFRGIITDVGGPTANMYAAFCPKMEKNGACRDKSCLFPKPCPSLKISHKPVIDVLGKISSLKGVRKVFAASGVRPDLVEADVEWGGRYLEVLCANHVSGQLKLAPETADRKTLCHMGKPGPECYVRFIEKYKRCSAAIGKDQYVTCYFMAAHPGADHGAALETGRFAEKYLAFSPEQVQIFTPTPSTWSTCMYYTGADRDGRPVFSEKTDAGKTGQKLAITGRAGKGGRAAPERAFKEIAKTPFRRRDGVNSKRREDKATRKSDAFAASGAAALRKEAKDGRDGSSSALPGVSSVKSAAGTGNFRDKKSGGRKDRKRK